MRRDAEGAVTSRNAEDRQRFEALTLPHLGAHYRFAAKFNGNRATAEDLVQELYLKLIGIVATTKPDIVAGAAPASGR